MIRLVLMSVLMLLVFSSTAFSQFSFDFTGTGARAQGMGNAFLAISDDISAATWNPAGLTAHEKLIIGFDFDNYSPENKFMNGSDSFLDNPSFSSVSQLSVVIPFRLRGRLMIFGFSYGRSFEEYWNDGFENSDIFVNQIRGFDRDSSTIDFIGASQDHSYLSVLNIATGTKFTPEISGGASLNIYTGQRVGVFDSITTIPHFISETTFPQYVNHVVFQETIDTAFYSGVNFTFGGKYDGEQFDLGVVIRTPFDLNAESDIKVNSRTVEAAEGQTEMLIVGSDTTYFDNRLTKFNIPWIFGMGVAVNPVENLTLALDGEYRRFYKQKVLVRDSIHIRPGSANDEFYTEYDLTNYNSQAIRVGAEYNWKTSWESFPLIPIRAGFSAVSSIKNYLTANTEATESRLSLEQSWTNSFHVGLGIKWSQVYLDAALTFSSMEVPTNYSDVNWDNSSTSFVVGFTGYF